MTIRRDWKAFFEQRLRSKSAEIPAGGIDLLTGIAAPRVT